MKRLSDSEIQEAMRQGERNKLADQKTKLGRLDSLPDYRLRAVSEATAQRIKDDVMEIIKDWDKEEFFNQLRVTLRRVEAYFEEDK